MRSALAVPLTVAGQMLAAAATAAVVTAVSLVAIARVEWPAYNSSNQLHALTTVGQFVCLAGLLGAGWLHRSERTRSAWTAAVSDRMGGSPPMTAHYSSREQEAESFLPVV